MSAVQLDFARTIVITRHYPDVEQFGRDLQQHGLLAGVVREQPSLRDGLRLWHRRLRRHGLPATASRGIALALDRLVDRLTDPRSEPTDERPLRVPELVVPTVNAEEAAAFVRQLAPTLGIVVGTSVLGRSLIRSFPAGALINLHVGMAPRYRGSHGGAWAIIEGRPEDVVTTIHFVDEGIDTGKPLAYVPVEPRPTLASLVRAQRRAGLEWLRGTALAGLPTGFEPQDVPERRDLLYPPQFSQWRTFRRRSRELTVGTTW